VKLAATSCECAGGFGGRAPAPAATHCLSILSTGKARTHLFGLLQVNERLAQRRLHISEARGLHHLRCVPTGGRARIRKLLAQRCHIVLQCLGLQIKTQSARRASEHSCALLCGVHAASHPGSKRGVKCPAAPQRFSAGLSLAADVHRYMCVAAIFVSCTVYCV